MSRLVANEESTTNDDEEEEEEMPTRHRRRHRWRHAGGRLARGAERGELACADGRRRIAGVGGVGGP